MRERWWHRGRGAYRGELSRRTVAFRTATGVGVVVVAALLLGLAGVDPVGRARDLVADTRASGRLDSGVTAEAAGQESVPEHPAAWVVDHVRGRGWTTLWDAASAGDPAAACTAATEASPAAGAAPLTPAATALSITLPGPTNVRQVGVEAGLAADDPAVERLSRWRPRTLELRWSLAGAPVGCTPVALADTAALQRIDIEGAEADAVRVVVVAAYPPADGPGASDRLDLAELTFWRR